MVKGWASYTYASASTEKVTVCSVGVEVGEIVGESVIVGVLVVVGGLPVGVGVPVLVRVGVLVLVGVWVGPAGWISMRLCT